MEYTVTIDSQEYELPKKTLKIAKLIDAAKTATTSEISYRKQLELVETCIGTDKTIELLGSNRLDDIDLVMLSIAFLKIENGYLKPVEEVRESLQENDLAKLKDLAKFSESLGNIGNLVENMK